ncbi:OmpA family protein [Flavimaricola marinus]|uniref:Outer membrane lipoprotein Omp16 n=1 Tax=Flavimaricola marinus TaxID=1819565 RepID=A0A238LCD4_9RHOB|nr:OmpA family protein [Flavimaricola marinus]SMY06590.1 Outer membrane lipoprotein Omp16 precursor [Flavimaricola marinus]
MKYLAITLAAGIALTGCTANDDIVASFYREVGTTPDPGGFGTAVNQNVAINNGDESYRVNLARRFDAEVQSTVNFAFNSTALDAEARAILRQQADFIKQFPEVRFTVYGHTDLVGSSSYNRQLGLRRAETVVLYLTSQGISRSRLEALASFGETQPLIVTEGRERANRRTVTEVSGFVEDHPSVLNGKYAEIIFREYIVSAEVPATIGGITGAELGTSE